MLEMGNFKQIHADRRCWIVGNGPSLNSMDLGFLQREGSPDEGDVAMVEEAPAEMGGSVGPGGDLGASPQVDAPQH